MSLLLTILFFILLLSFLVLIHEAGHFVAAKLFGVKVYEFGLGYPPLAKKLFKKWGTWFTLNWLPFGGFVRLAGEERGLVSESEMSQAERKQMFYEKKAWQKLIVILAGASINFVFGIIAFAIMFTFLGIPTSTGVVLSEVMENTPASEAGLEAGWKILAVEANGKRYDLSNVSEFVAVVSRFAGESVKLDLEKEGFFGQKEIYVREASEIPEGQGAIGVAISPEDYGFVKYAWWQMPFRGGWYGLQEALRFGWEILMAIGGMVGQMVSGSVPADVGGPVRIVYEAKKANLLQEGPLAILNFAAILSINLAMVNVLPIPALDGGRAVFIVFEAVMGKRFKPKYEQYGNAAGMLVLLCLIVLISFRDIGTVLSENGWGIMSIINLVGSLFK